MLPSLFTTSALALLLTAPGSLTAAPGIAQQRAPECSAKVADSSGGIIVAWPDNRRGPYDIYAQRMGANGVPQWTLDGTAVCTASGDQTAPTVVPDGLGGAFVTWQDLRNGTSDIYAQRLSADGVPLWPLDGVAVCTATGTQVSPVVVADGSGGVIITWQDQRSGAYDIYAQHVSGGGVPLWTADGVPVCAATGDQKSPIAFADEVGGVIAVWEDGRGVGGIYAQRLDGSGMAQWVLDGVAVSSTFQPGNLGAVLDGSGGIIIAWDDLGHSGREDLYAQRLSAGGVPLWTAGGVAVCTAAYYQRSPVLVAEGSGGAFIAWTDYRSDRWDAVYAQRVDGAGVPQWTTNGVPVCPLAGGADFQTMASDGSGA